MSCVNKMLLTKAEFLNECHNKINGIKNKYSDSVLYLYDKGVTVEYQLLFYSYGKYFSAPKKSRGKIKVRISIYPSKFSKSNAEKMFVMKRIYSVLGEYRKCNDEYRVFFTDKSDALLKHYFNKIVLKIRKKKNYTLKQTIGDVFRSFFYRNRYGTDFDKHYRGFSLYWLIVLLCIVIIFLFRIIIPTGYHP